MKSIFFQIWHSSYSFTAPRPHVTTKVKRDITPRLPVAPEVTCGTSGHTRIVYLTLPVALKVTHMAQLITPGNMGDSRVPSVSIALQCHRLLLLSFLFFFLWPTCHTMSTVFFSVLYSPLLDSISNLLLLIPPSSVSTCNRLSCGATRIIFIIYACSRPFFPFLLIS